MDWQIDWSKTICRREQLIPNKKEEEQLYKKIGEMKREMNERGDEQPEIIAEENLKNYTGLIIETKQYDIDGEEFYTKMGLVNVKVDETRKELSGTRVLMKVGTHPALYERMTFRLSNYGKNYRAWTKYPTERKDWD